MNIVNRQKMCDAIRHLHFTEDNTVSDEGFFLIGLTILEP